MIRSTHERNRARLHVALQVADLNSSVQVCTARLGTSPNVIDAHTARFTVDEPPFTLLLVKDPDATTTITHLAVQLATAAQLANFGERLGDAGLSCEFDNNHFWIIGLDDLPWLFFFEQERLDEPDQPGTTDMQPEGATP